MIRSIGLPLSKNYYFLFDSHMVGDLDLPRSLIVDEADFDVFRR